MRPVTRVGRWAWALCGLASAAALAVGGTLLILSAGIQPPPARGGQGRQVPRFLEAQVQSWTVIVPQRVTSLNVQSFTGLVQVTAAPVTHVQVTETFIGRPPAVVRSVSGGRLSLTMPDGRPSVPGPACARLGCPVGLAVKVPANVTVSVTAARGVLIISGIAGANVDSLGAPVLATSIHGPLTVSTHGAPLQINGLTGPLRADTGGGQVIATGVTAATAVVSTGGGPAQVGFSAAPTSVTVRTGGGLASLIVPGGPYALSANSDGAPQIIGIATRSTASHSIAVTTGGGQLVISPDNRGTHPLLPPDWTFTGLCCGQFSEYMPRARPRAG